jgi:wyosine [tRNA(Phe)-imidazoG37] synthetase (radical SAM superfamily)
MTMIAFGPVPTRRLGQSLGINHIPPKHCTYNCAYCQVGPTAKEIVKRKPFYEPDLIFEEVRKKVQAAHASGVVIDYLTFVPDGEPALDLHLGEAIDLLKPLAIPIAVISNASLIWREDVREELARADVVSLKVDSVLEHEWRKVNRPHASLQLAAILEGALAFAGQFSGRLITETMLLRDVNDSLESLKATADWLGRLSPGAAYIGIPTRPPSEPWAQAPGEEAVALAYQLFSKKVKAVELLLGFPEEAFSTTGDPVQSILDITCVHPMREREALDLLAKKGLTGDALEALVEGKQLVRVKHGADVFYVRKLSFQ